MPPIRTGPIYTTRWTLADAVSPPYAQECTTSLINEETRRLKRKGRAAIRTIHKRYPDIPISELRIAFETNDGAVVKVINNQYNKTIDEVSEDPRYTPKALLARVDLLMWLKSREEKDSMASTTICICIPEEDSVTESEEEEEFSSSSEDEELTSPPARKMANTRSRSVIGEPGLKKSTNIRKSPSTAAPKPVKLEKKAATKTSSAMSRELTPKTYAKAVASFFRAGGYNLSNELRSTLWRIGLGPAELLALRKSSPNSADIKKVLQGSLKTKVPAVQVDVLSDTIRKSKPSAWKILSDALDTC